MRIAVFILAACAFLGLFPRNLRAQTFQTVPALYFTSAFGGASPLPQTIAIASTGAGISFTSSASTTTGGSWLTISTGTGCCNATPFALTVTATPGTLAAGTYSGQVTVKSSSGTITMTIPVTLTVEATTATFFDDLPGALTFSMAMGGTAPPSQPIQIRNAGAGTLSWTASGTTADGGAWLSLSATSGTAPSVPSVSIIPAHLPGIGLTAGTFAGQVVLLSSGGDRVTIPVTATVGAAVFTQVNGLNFTKVFAGANPLPQVIALASTGAAISFTSVAVNSTGGNWLSVSTGTGCCNVTPFALTVTANPAVTLAAGTYSAEVIFDSSNAEALVVPVTLTIEPTTATFFDDLPGELTFSMATGGTAPPSQPLQIHNAGAGSLSWTASSTTSDGGTWLSLSATGGTAPSVPSVSINPAHLPGTGLTAGTFTGQIVLQSSGGDRTTVPVSITVGAAVFSQVDGLNFTKVFGGGNPLPQVITVASTGAAISFTSVAVNSTGGNWLTISAGTGCCNTTPFALTATVNPAITLVAGTYSAEIIFDSSNGEAMVVPVTLTVQNTTDTFFDDLPGELTFSMATGGSAPPSQPLQIRNAGGGSLAWTASTSTADGGAWLSLSATSGTAPSVPSVSIIPSHLPGTGLTPGTFTGQVVLLAADGNRVTIPVTATVGASVFRQVNGLNFTKLYAGANPLPQVISLASTGSAISFTSVAVNSTGGNWLSISTGTGCCNATPFALTVTANPAVTLAAGTYSAEIIFDSTGGESLVVPVTLTIKTSTAAFFDTLPGELTFSMATGGTAPVAQQVPIRNVGTGTMDWTGSVSTADGGGWLSLSASSGSAPSTPTVSITPSHLPGTGLVAGTFNGQVVLVAADGVRVTIPVTVTVGTSVFNQIAPLSFSKTFDGANPSSQAITISSTSAALSFSSIAENADGGNWLTISTGTGCCNSTPFVLNVSVNPAATLASGVYAGEINFLSTTGEPMAVPVTLTINSNTAAATPAFTPAGGTYSSAQSVTITDSTPGSGIHFTTDGSSPTSSSPTYSGPISVTKSETIRAIAVAPGYLQSATGSATYTITAPVTATPAITQTITISDATAGAVVYYTTNGSTPTTSSTPYTGPIVLNASSVLKFIAVAPGLSPSAVKTITSTIQ